MVKEEEEEEKVDLFVSFCVGNDSKSHFVTFCVGNVIMNNTNPIPSPIETTCFDRKLNSFMLFASHAPTGLWRDLFFISLGIVLLFH